MTTPVIVTTRLVIHHSTGDDPFSPGPWHDLVLRHRDEHHAPNETPETRAPGGVDVAGVLGTLGIRAEPAEPTLEVRIVVSEAARGQGYATEALRAVVEHALAERSFARVVAFVAAAESRAQRLFERVGMRAVAADGDDLVYLIRAETPRP